MSAKNGDANICFPTSYVCYLPRKTRQGFAHDVDHGLRSPTVATVVKKGKSEDLTVDGGDVAGQCDHIVGGARLGVEISFGGGVPHSTLEQLGVSGNRQR